MNILWISDSPFVNSSYAIQSKLLIPLLQKYHNIIYYGITYTGVSTTYNGIPIVGNSYDMDKGLINHYIERYDIDVVFTMKDPFYFSVDVMKKLNAPWIAFAPVDTEPASVLLKSYLHYALSIFTPTEWSKWELEQYALPVVYTPHGIDSNHFTIGKAEKFRKRFHIGKDQIVYNFVGDNRTFPSRKNIDLLLMAWAEFSRNYSEEVVLFLHTNTMGSIKVGLMLEALGIAEYSYRFTPQDEYFAGCDDNYMRDLYQASNWGIYLSGGEGFNLPIVENQMCGVPIIGTHFTAQRETGRSGIFLQKGELQWELSGGFRVRPKMEDVLEVLNQSLILKDIDPHSVRENVIQYDLKTVEPLWLDAFAHIERLINGH